MSAANFPTIVLRKKAYAPEALVEAGVPASLVRTLVADGPRAIPERPFLSLHGRKREKAPTTYYVWGPDAAALLNAKLVR